MTNNTHTIYEFSTSIGIKITSDGRWQSTGFQDGWKNNTYDGSQASTIPEPVRQAIANKEFKLAESDRSPFAVIGRLVKRQGCKTWAVVAFVILGVDNRGRDVPVYRYFCCQAENDESALESMDDILYRVVSYSHDHGKLPFFDPQLIELAKCNPIDKQAINSSITLSEEQQRIVSTNIGSTKLELPKGFIENSMVAGNAYALIKLNTFTWERALATGQVVISHGSYKINNFAWAYNVQTLERSESFVVIQTANQSLKEVRGSSSDGFVAGVNEQGLKAAIKAITELQQFKVEKVIELSTILQDEKLRNVQFLSKVFEDLAGRGILPNTSHPTSIKLFVLRVFLTSSVTFNPFLKWFNQQDPQGKLVNIYNKFEQDFFNTIEGYPNECATLKEMVSGEVCQAVLESLLIKREISPERLHVLMQNSRWIKRQYLLDTIRDGIIEVDSEIDANTPFSGSDIWKPLERFIQNVQSLSGRSSNPIQRIPSNTELPKWLKNILPDFITDHLGDRWQDINHSQAKRAEAKEQENKLIQAEVYYSPLAELLRMLCPNTDEHFYFDYISNPQKRLPLSYFPIGDANNAVDRRFNLTIGKSISIDTVENKLARQYISFIFLTLISVVVITAFYLGFSIIVLIVGSLWNLIKYIISGFIHILKQIFNWTVEGGGNPPEPVEKYIKDQITKLLSVDYSNTYYSKPLVSSSIELIFKKLANHSHSERVAFEVIKTVFEDIESGLKNSSVHDSLTKTEKLKFFRAYFLSEEQNEINLYLEHFKTLENPLLDTVLSFQNGFRKILEIIKEENRYNQNQKDYIKPFLKDVIDFILGKVIDSKEDSSSYETIVYWIGHRRSFVSSLDLTKYINTDVSQFINPDASEICFLCDSNFWEDLRNIWQHFKETRKMRTASKYANLARFLEYLSQELSNKRYDKEYEYTLSLSAYFQQISQGYVSEVLFQKFVSPVVYGLTLLNPTQFNDPNRSVSFTHSSNNSENGSTKYSHFKSNEKVDYIKWTVNGIILIIFLLVCLFALKPSPNSGDKPSPEITSSPTPTESNFSGGISSSNTPSPKPDNKSAKSKLTCKAIINGKDLNLIVSNIPVEAKEIYSLMYVLNEPETGKLELKPYSLVKLPTNKKMDLTIPNLDGDGPPDSGKIYYIIASTQKPPEYKTPDKLSKDAPIFKQNQATEDPCYVFITPP